MRRRGSCHGRLRVKPAQVAPRTASSPVPAGSLVAGRLVMLHWLGLALLAASLLTGWRIHASNRALDAAPAWTALLPGGAVHAAHVAAGAAWLLLALAYVLHLRARPRRPAPPRLAGRVNGGLIDLLRTALPATMVCGAVLYGLGTAAGQGWWLAMHHALAWVLLGGVAAHALVGGWPGVRFMLWPAGLRLAALWQVGLVLPLLAAAILAGWAWQAAPAEDELRVYEVGLDQPFELDGRAAEPAWQQAQPSVVVTTLPGPVPRAVPVTVQAVRQGEVLRFLFTWPDEQASLQHLPLVKTAQGWQVQHDGLLQHDERRFYEDKFAVLLAAEGGLVGQGSLQLGPVPAEQAGNTPGVHHGHRGYHATADGRRVDVWQWKAVRLAPFGQLDDSHFGPPYPAVPGERRHTAGYRPDPAWSGGYADNWQWLEAQRVVPKRLPRDPALLAPFQPGAGPQPVWGMMWHETRPYEPQLDTYPVGTHMPSVLWKTVFEGDRGDVLGRAHWAQGTWTLEAARGLRAESRHDVELAEGTCLWVAVFDHAQTRHTYHLRPLRLHFR
jgi:hypothetical protein